MLLGRWLFLKNRVPFLVIGIVCLLALIGLVSSVVSNPVGFMQNILSLVVIGLLIWFIVRRFYKASPERKEQKAFVKAAKRSKKRQQHTKGKLLPKQGAQAKTATFKGKKRSASSAHLTVIEGKKSKKKNRATF